MKIILCALILLTLTTVAAKADTLTIVLDQPDQMAAPGQTLQFFGSITNDSDTTVYLNSDDFTLNGLSFTVNDLFFDTVPFFLAPSGQSGDSSGDIELFDITVSDPLLDGAATYPGIYDLVGGIDGNASDDLGSASFSVTTVPEPSTLSLLLAGASLVLVPIWRKARR
jgi:PEP-CTERM motif